MSAAAPAQSDTKPSRSGRLLALVRKLIDYAQELAETARERVATIFAKTNFGNSDLAAIFRRIARGLLLAQALEARVLSRAAALDKGPRPCRARSAPKRNQPTSPPARETEPLLAKLPTPEQIATQLDPWLAAGLDPMVRHRPIGTMLVDICRDLGILPSHPLWRDVQRAIIEFGGSLVAPLKDLLSRLLSPDGRHRRPAVLREPTPRLEAPACTGPPPR
jgi:hypothetical protein